MGGVGVKTASVVTAVQIGAAKAATAVEAAEARGSDVAVAAAAKADPDEVVSVGEVAGRGDASGKARMAEDRGVTTAGPETVASWGDGRGGAGQGPRPEAWSGLPPGPCPGSTPGQLSGAA